MRSSSLGTCGGVGESNSLRRKSEDLVVVGSVSPAFASPRVELGSVILSIFQEGVII